MNSCIHRLRPNVAQSALHQLAKNLLLLCIALLLTTLSITSAHAACSTKWQGKAWFNEYFFGSGGDAPPNFLEVYSTDNSFPAKWQNWSIDVYTSQNSKTTYPLTTSTGTACTVGNKTWLTSNVVSGLRQQNALVLLRDDQGAYVDAFVFDNSDPPAPWPGPAASGWFPDLNSAAGCPALASALTTQAGNSGSIAKQYNMLVLKNYGNKDMARDPDGGPIWDLTSNTGAGTTYTQCVSNNANFTKTVDNSTPAPGSTITYTLNMANTGNSSMSGVSIVDSMPPAPLTFLSATSSNPSDPAVVMSAYTVYDPYLQKDVTAPRLTWTPAAIPGNTVSRLYIKMQVANDAVQGRSYLNTAQTAAGLTDNQTDFANVTIGSPNTPSFAISVSPATSTTCTPALLGPKVTITAMSAANGGGTKLTGYNGTVTLTTSRPTPRWHNSAGVALTGNTVTLQNGEVSLYLTDSVEESFTVSAIDATTFPDVVMYGTSGEISFTDSSTGLALIDADTLSPAYGVVAGRPHAVRARLSSCGTTSATTGSYSGTIHYVPGLNHPSGAAAPTINPSAASCPGTVAPPLSTAGTPITLNFSSGVATFYLCTTDVGQYALGLRIAGIPNNSGTTGVSSNFTVRPFAITATGFTQGTTANPGGTGRFAAAGTGFSGTLRAWQWLSSADDNVGPRGDGLPDSDTTAAGLAGASPGLTPRFSGTINNAGVVNLAPAMVAPATGNLGSFTPGSATLASGIVNLNNVLSYSEVGNIRVAGADGTGMYAATNYLGAAGVNIPILSDVVGRFVPDHFLLANATVAAKPSCSGSLFSYMGEPFNIAFMLTARNAAGVKTQNYEGSFAFLDPSAANWTIAGHNTDGSFGPGAFSGGADLSSRLAWIGASASGWNDGSNQVSADLRFARGASGPDGPFNLSIGIAPRDLDGVALRNEQLTMSSARAPLGARDFRFGRLRPFSSFVAGQTALGMPLETQYWTGKSWALSSDDNCTAIPATAVTPTAYLDGKGAAVTGQTIGVAPTPVQITGGRGTLALTKPAGMSSGSVDLCFDLGTGLDCTGVSAGLGYLQWGSAGSGTYTDPSARATFGVYAPETRRTVHVRELF